MASLLLVLHCLSLSLFYCLCVIKLLLFLYYFSIARFIWSAKYDYCSFFSLLLSDISLFFLPQHINVYVCVHRPHNFIFAFIFHSRTSSYNIEFLFMCIMWKNSKKKKKVENPFNKQFKFNFFNTFYPRIIENRRILHLSINSIFSYFCIMFMFNIHNSCCSFLSFRLILIYLFFSSFRFYFILLFILLWFFLLIRISPFCC